jgi:heat shock protein HtpX
MLGTLAIVVSISSLFFAVILVYLGSLNILSLVTLVTIFNLAQWLFAPYLIDAIYRVRKVDQKSSPKLYKMVEDLSEKSGIKTPRLGISKIKIPNAFAYGSPITGSRVAVTQGLLNTLEEKEVEAVLGHEFGHLRNRDVQIMMLISFLPSLFYIIGRSLTFSAYYGTYNRDRRGGSAAALIGAASIFIYFILSLLTLNLSRLREYFADRHSASIVDDGPRHLSEALTKIVSHTNRMRNRNKKEAFTFNGFKALFISDPDKADSDVAQIAKYAMGPSNQVQSLIRKKLTTGDRIIEIFSTHPNITKRLRALQALRT